MKILFIGHPGSGKTYAADALCKQTQLKKIDIDTLFDKYPLSFLSKTLYRKVLGTLIKNEEQWIIDGYHGRRMPDSIWKEADVIAFIDLPRAELRQNIINRYKTKKASKQYSHGQSTFINTLKNLGQIYFLDASLRKNVSRIQSLIEPKQKFVVLKSRQDINAYIEALSHSHRKAPTREEQRSYFEK